MRQVQKHNDEIIKLNVVMISHATTENCHDDDKESGDDDVDDDNHHHVILNSKKVYKYILNQEHNNRYMI